MRDDTDLAQAAQNGDQEAFETLYRRHVRSVYDAVFFRTRQRQTAEDIVSQTFLQAYERLGSFAAKRGSFAGWIHRIARNLTVDHFRRLHPQAPIESVWDLSDDTDVPAAADAALRLGEVKVLLQGLTPKQRETVLLRVWHGRTFAEIAQILDTSEAAAKMTYKRTLEKLRNALFILLGFFFLSPHA